MLPCWRSMRRLVLALVLWTRLPPDGQVIPISDGVA